MPKREAYAFVDAPDSPIGEPVSGLSTFLTAEVGLCAIWPDGRSEVEGAQSASFAQISVSDTGVGIPSEEHDAVFDKVHQVGSGISGAPGGLVWVCQSRGNWWKSMAAYLA